MRDLYRLDGGTPEGIAWLVDTADSVQADIFGFLAELSLKTDADMCPSHVERVSLLTMHAAKGLEFPVVFICGCEEGLVPYENRSAGVCRTEEERRLFYVALTRAKRRLFLTHAKKRRLHGQRVSRKPSPFIRDIAVELLARQTRPRADQTGPPPPVQRKLF